MYFDFELNLKNNKKYLNQYLKNSTVRNVKSGLKRVSFKLTKNNTQTKNNNKIANVYCANYHK